MSGGSNGRVRRRGEALRRCDGDVPTRKASRPVGRAPSVKLWRVRSTLAVKIRPGRSATGFLERVPFRGPPAHPGPLSKKSQPRTRQNLQLKSTSDARAQFSRPLPKNLTHRRVTDSSIGRIRNFLPGKVHEMGPNKDFFEWTVTRRGWCRGREGPYSGAQRRDTTKDTHTNTAPEELHHVVHVDPSGDLSAARQYNQ